MPNARPAYRRLSGSDNTPPTSSKGGQHISPLLIEAGGFYVLLPVVKLYNISVLY